MSLLTETGRVIHTDSHTKSQSQPTIRCTHFAQQNDARPSVPSLKTGAALRAGPDVRFKWASAGSSFLFPEALQTGGGQTGRTKTVLRREFAFENLKVKQLWLPGEATTEKQQPPISSTDPFISPSRQHRRSLHSPLVT